MGEACRVTLPELKNKAKKVVATVGHPTINRAIAFIFLAGALVPNLDDQKDNFLVSEDSHGWTGTYNTGMRALGGDFNAANGTMNCEWFAEHDPGCKGAWLDALLGGVKVDPATQTLTQPYELTIANGQHSQLLPAGWKLSRPQVTCPLSASGTFLHAVESCIDANGADCGVTLGASRVRHTRWTRPIISVPAVGV